MIRAVLFDDGGDPCGLSRKQIRQPRIAFGILPCTTHKRRHADNEQLAQIFVAHLGDTTEPLFATARMRLANIASLSNFGGIIEKSPAMPMLTSHI